VAFRVVSAGLTDVGKKRPHNEDYYYVDDGVGLYIVADGVGGHAKGEIASQEAVDQMRGWVRSHLKDVDKASATATNSALLQARRMLESGVQSACYMVYGMAEQDPEKKGMSTTMSVLLIRGKRAFVAQVGDSRVYRMRQGAVEQMTEDHTLINYRLKNGLITPEEAKKASGKNVITRAVGHKDYVQVDTLETLIEEGDRFFLCTDGLHGYLETDAGPLVDMIGAEPLDRGVKKAIDFANAAGGKDNITAVLVAVKAADRSRLMG
jgi:protein phosphatase